MPPGAQVELALLGHRVVRVDLEAMAGVRQGCV